MRIGEEGVGVVAHEAEGNLVGGAAGGADEVGWLAGERLIIGA